LNNSKIKILDTRKTLPNLRELQKYAVKCGGGKNHRFNLADLILIKDNHINACGGVDKALERVLSNTNNVKIEIECDNYLQVVECLKFNPNIIMLDNMNFEELQKSIDAIRNHSKAIEIEVSGGINLENIHHYKNFDIDFISIGSLTNSAKIVDIGLDFI
jgi:nicotinate-nucleotide pyrophosphorylase (carboxylating)